MGRNAGSIIETVEVDDLRRWTLILICFCLEQTFLPPDVFFVKVHGVKMIELPTRSKYVFYRYALSKIMISYKIDLYKHNNIHT